MSKLRGLVLILRVRVMTASLSMVGRQRLTHAARMRSGASPGGVWMMRIITLPDTYSFGEQQGPGTSTVLRRAVGYVQNSLHRCEAAGWRNGGSGGAESFPAAEPPPSRS